MTLVINFVILHILLLQKHMPRKCFKLDTYKTLPKLVSNFLGYTTAATNLDVQQWQSPQQFRFVW